MAIHEAARLMLEIYNTTPLPARVYANEGISQFLFLKGDSPCEVSYADRAGKYMKQLGVTLPRIAWRSRRFDVVILPRNVLRRTITRKPAHQGSSEDFFS